jgi:four helix bundle protein
MKYTSFEELPVWQAAIELARRVHELTAHDAFHRHPGLRKQVERAALSIPNNVAEGFDRGATNELLAFLHSARGSAGEVRSMLCLLERIAAFSALKPDTTNLKSACLDISKQLYGWIAHLKNSTVAGQRHRNDTSRPHAAADQ